MIGALVAVEEGASSNAERDGEQIDERNADQTQADQAKPGSGRQAPPDESQFLTKPQPPPFERRVKEVEARNGCTERNAACRRQYRSNDRYQVQGNYLPILP